MVYKYSVSLPDGVIYESDNLRTVYKIAESERRFSIYCGEGSFGYRIINNVNGSMVFEFKPGKNVTLREAEVSVRLYNTTMRHLQRQGLLKDGQHDISLGDLRNLVEAGHMAKARNVGIKTYVELFKVLRDYTGWSYNLNKALMECMNNMPNGLHWLQTKGLSL